MSGLLLEDGSSLLLEDGSVLLLESDDPEPGRPSDPTVATLHGMGPSPGPGMRVILLDPNPPGNEP